MRALLLFALLPLAACEGDFTYNVTTPTSGADAQDHEQGVQDYLKSSHGITVESVSCGDDVTTPSAEIGAVINVVPCTVQQTEGEPYPVEIRTANISLPDEEPSQNDTIWMPGSIVVPKIEQQLGAHFAEVTGGSVSSTCAGPRVIPSMPGHTVDCEISDGTNRSAVLITVTDEDGGIDFEVLD